MLEVVQLESGAGLKRSGAMRSTVSLGLWLGLVLGLSVAGATEPEPVPVDADVVLEAVTQGDFEAAPEAMPAIPDESSELTGGEEPVAPASPADASGDAAVPTAPASPADASADAAVPTAPSSPDDGSAAADSTAPTSSENGSSDGGVSVTADPTALASPENGSAVAADPTAPVEPADASAIASEPAAPAGQPEAQFAADPVGMESTDGIDGATDATSTGPLTISGASTIQPIMAELARSYQERTGSELRISGGGSGRGISDVRAGTSIVGMVSRSLRDSEKADLQYTTIGLDTLVFIVNDANPQTQIVREQLVDLYTRRVDWQTLNGFAWPVRLVSKEVGRSTLDLFEEFSGLTSPDRSQATSPLISRETTVIGSNLEALTLVGGSRGAMGYVSLGAALSLREQGLPIKILALAGVTPSAATIQSGQYPIRRELNLVYRERTAAVTALLALINSPEGQAVVEQAGFIPIGGR